MGWIEASQGGKPPRWEIVLFGVWGLAVLLTALRDFGGLGWSTAWTVVSMVVALLLLGISAAMAVTRAHWRDKPVPAAGPGGWRIAVLTTPEGLKAVRLETTGAEEIAATIRAGLIRYPGQDVTARVDLISGQVWINGGKSGRGQLYR
jgi:hypothetical protein